MEGVWIKVEALEKLKQQIAELEAERDNFHMEYRMKCDVETKQLHEELAALRAAIVHAAAEIGKEKP